jgi:Ca-activated chloride channel family protein
LGLTALVGAFASACLADGMIVPVRPEVRVRGAWAVKYHRVDVKVRDQIAMVTIDQAFVNTGRRAIEVEYLFPVPPAAAIDSMTLLVNGREYTAKLLKADEARKVYESIVRRKKDPALLEYAGFGLYRTKAFPLEPGKPARVVVTYKDRCRKDRNVVEVWYPLNTEKFSAKPLDEVRVAVDIRSRADIGPVYSPTHSVNIKRDPNDARHVTVTYEEKKTLPTTDFQVFYKTDNKKIGATLLTHQGRAAKDGYFMLLVSPNPRASVRTVAPKNVIVVLDRSGSMSGEKIRQACNAVRFILNNLNENDLFNVVAYNDSVETFHDELAAPTPKRLADALDRVDRIEAGGGTDIDAALKAAFRAAAAGHAEGPPRPTYVIFATDGKPTSGQYTGEKDILANARKANTMGARVFAFGVGYDVNIRLLDKLVGDHKGRSDYVKPKEDIEAKISSLYSKIKNPVMTDVTMRIEGLELRDVYPRELGDLFDGDQLVAAGRFRRTDAAKGSAHSGEGFHTTLIVTGTYQGNQRTFEYPVTVRPAGRDTRFVFVERLWAIRRVGYLLDQIQLHGESKEVVDEIIRLSRDYGIMTPYTSFLADETTRLADADQHRHAFRKAEADLGVVTGAAGQRHAMNRQKLNTAAQPAAAKDSAGRVVMRGSGTTSSYEEGRDERVENVRQVGNNTLYRRGNTWQTPDAAKLAAEKAAETVVVDRFSEEYFRLVRANTVEENQILSSQRGNEELLIQLRGRLYRIR